MDVLQENGKRICPENQQILGLNYDRISNLPVDIIYHILSFLDTPEVVKTGLLSKKWRYIWKSVPHLHYDFLVFYNEHCLNYTKLECLSRFWELVKHDLIIRDTSPTYKLQFLCDVYGEDQFKLLVSFCALRNVEELILLANLKVQCNPCGYVLHKQKIYTGVNLQQSLWAFGNLKTLQLIKVQFPHPDITGKLFSDCGVLENLIIRWCCFGKINVLNILAHKLKMIIFTNENYKHPKSNLCAFKGELKFHTPELVSFAYIGLPTQTFEFSSDMPLLNHFMISYSIGVIVPNLSPKLETMVSRIRSVKELSLSKAFVLYFSLGEPCCKLNYLRFLKLNAGCRVDFMKGLINLLKLSPNLEVLCVGLTLWSGQGPSTVGIWKSRKEDVPCLSNRLRTIDISDYNESPPWELVRFFLLNGKSVEKMRIVQRKESEIWSPLLMNVLHTIPLASEALSVDVITISNLKKVLVYQFISERARDNKNYLRMKPSRRSSRIAALKLKSRGSS